MNKTNRMTDRTHRPTEEDMRKVIGRPGIDAWIELLQFITNGYGLEAETRFYGQKYGWTVRYRKSGKTLCSLFPEKGGFTVLIVLGKKEAEKSLLQLKEFRPKTQVILKETPQLHDGRWLWLKIGNRQDIEDVKKLLQIKRRPKKP